MRPPDSDFREVDAGIQYDLDGNQIEVRVIGKGQVKQISMDDYLELRETEQGHEQK